MTHGAVDASDMYRAAIVQVVAALDHYIHGVVLDRAVSILMGRLAPGPSTKIGMSFDAVGQVLAASTEAEREAACRTQVAQRLALETFQKADSIASGLTMVGVSKIWVTAFGQSAQATRTALNLIVERRNRIAHQGDADPLNPGFLTPLSPADVGDVIDTVHRVGAGIDPHL